jgi:hypothetical protein
MARIQKTFQDRNLQLSLLVVQYFQFSFKYSLHWIVWSQILYHVCCFGPT